MITISTEHSEQADRYIGMLQDETQRDNILYYHLSGDYNKRLRRAIVARLTGDIKPLGQCGINHINELLNR